MKHFGFQPYYIYIYFIIITFNIWINKFIFILYLYNLMIPCKSDIDKKNRNLYAILLINQMVNGKLEEPFIKFANSFNDLKQLSPENIKAELTKKFYEERRNRFSKN